MNSEKAVRDVNSVDLLRARHEELRAEIETRQDTFNTVIRTGEDMIQKEHYAKDEVGLILVNCSYRCYLIFRTQSINNEPFV